MVVNAPRAICVVDARDGRDVLVLPRLLFRKSNARDDVFVPCVDARARTEVLPVARVVVAFRGVIFVAVRDTTDASRVAVNGAEFVRNNESVPRTAADDAPMKSAIVVIKIINFFISV